MSEKDTPDADAQAKIKELENELAEARYEVRQAKQRASMENIKSDNKLLISRASEPSSFSFRNAISLAAS